MSPVAEDAGPDAALTRLFAARGAAVVTVPILQPADPYLDTAGEALRRRIFLTRGEGGEQLCLRPDFTIPVCLAHIAAEGVLPGRYAYCGLVFRQLRAEGSEFRQAGIEDLGHADPAAADARAVADALAALEAAGAPEDLDIVLGDQGLFEAVLAALGLPDGWQRRLVRTFGDDKLLGAALDDLARRDKRALDGLDPELHRLARSRDLASLKAAVEARMEEGGLSAHAGRTPGEIVARLVEKVEIAEASLSEGSLALLTEFLAIDRPLAEASAALDGLARRQGLQLGAGLAAFEARNRALQAAGVDLGAVRYRAAFGRPIDYYTGLVFEMRRPGAAEALAGGGRYDRLLTFLGAKAPIPAVGFSVWLDRIEAARGARA
ncbi:MULTISPECIES: ATP phosphoribosyltransferase regulatory subunit [unclassified Aureimonas]|uniref:ATP phosphoribosyltransferase regulatory subunit n=1 Tax=unclassified Aureimonas TaxID=2615206 RepID=UPI0006F6EC97|nr:MULTISPECIES: ATP phosphoribosyltransferase regulatory subunit [unclassified Aureimonas]KQT69750.1 ATP phosphoribosyltransferase regulatory subunit [Aureimonas sp. Leaf427]KQT76098.1 ATP phosphoribosyltransferase regulatory subunit [Aureimonas sp. Leaf460]